MYAIIQDKKEAARQYLHAALIGKDPEAYNCLGLIYENFECLEVDQEPTFLLPLENQKASQRSRDISNKKERNKKQ